MLGGQSSAALYAKSSAAHVPRNLAPRYGWRMDVAQIRLANLRRLIHEAGSLQALAERAGTSYDNLWQIANGTLLPSGKPRGIGNVLARRLEEGCRKPVGWMDWDNSAASASATARFIAEKFDTLPPEKQRLTREMFAAITGFAVPDDQVEDRMPITKRAKEGGKR